jgi:hypothetical protein
MYETHEYKRLNNHVQNTDGEHNSLQQHQLTKLLNQTQMKDEKNNPKL